MLITDQRILGMITSGAVGDEALDMDAGNVFAFTIDHEDLDRRRRTQTGAENPSKSSSAARAIGHPPSCFRSFSVAVVIKNDGSIVPTRIDSLVEALGERGGFG